MSQPFIGELRLFAGNFAPTGWAPCDGQLMSISQYSELYSLLGTTYGGDGQTTFGLPDLRGQAAIHWGTGAGVSYIMGQTGGAESVTITPPQLPSHNHTIPVASQASTQDPTGAVLAASGHAAYTGTPTTSFDATALSPQGGGQPHNNMPPYLVVNYIIALDGVFPSQS